MKILFQAAKQLIEAGVPESYALQMLSKLRVTNEAEKVAAVGAVQKDWQELEPTIKVPKSNDPTENELDEVMGNMGWGKPKTQTPRSTAGSVLDSIMNQIL